ncbi:MAG: PAN domain-containing protein [Rhizobiales bacterium]|nr:PAN domain-containing protein [Hyphomicrobiales bacterium]
MALVTLVVALLSVDASFPARAQVNFDRIGGDYLRSPVRSGDPADCAMICERDKRCRSWTFSYPTLVDGAFCWLKSSVPQRSQSDCCISGVRGAGVIEPHIKGIEMSTDRSGGDYRSFEVKGKAAEDHGKAACTGDNKGRAWTYARAGYAGHEARCFLKKEIKPPRRRPGFISGVVR